MISTARPGTRPRSGPRLAAAVVAVAACVLAGCGGADPSGAAPGAGAAASVTSCGRTVTVEAPPQRVVILSPMIARDLAALGLADRVVAQSGTDYFAPPPETAEVPVLSPGRLTSTESLLGARPDLVISELAYRFDPTQGGASLEQLEQAGVNAYVSAAGCTDNDTGRVEDQFTDLENLGRIFGVPDRARALADRLRGELADVERRVADQPRVPVFAGPLSGGEYYPAGGIGLDVLQLAGGASVFPAVVDANTPVSREEVTARDPSAIVQMVSEPASFDEARETAAVQAAFPTTAAVRDGRIYFVGYFATGTPGSAVEIVGGVRRLASLLQPTAFAG